MAGLARPPLDRPPKDQRVRACVCVCVCVSYERASVSVVTKLVESPESGFQPP